MKQFVGLYAVGEVSPDATNAISNLMPPVITATYMSSLYCTSEFFISPHLVIPILPETKGLYIGIISQGATREVKVVPVLYQNEELLASLLGPEVLEGCLNAMGAVFGMVDGGEATPAYVNQDQS